MRPLLRSQRCLVFPSLFVPAKAPGKPTNHSQALFAFEFDRERADVVGLPPLTGRTVPVDRAQRPNLSELSDCGWLMDFVWTLCFAFRPGDQRKHRGGSRQHVPTRLATLRPPAAI